MKLSIEINLNCRDFHGKRYHLVALILGRYEKEWRWHRPHRHIWFGTPWYKAWR